jgi:hypothetical protein
MLIVAASKKSYEAGFDTGETAKQKNMLGDDKVRQPSSRRSAHLESFS